MRINFYKALRAVGRATDLIGPALSCHHERTAFITHAIAHAAGVSTAVCRRAFIAALIHDIGGLTIQQRMAPLTYSSQLEMHTHATIGADLLASIELFDDISDIVRYHHTEWNYGEGMTFNNVKVPSESHIIFLADRIDTLVARIQGEDLLLSAKSIQDIILQDKGKRFKPELVDAFIAASKHASFWLALEENRAGRVMEHKSVVPKEYISLEEFRQLSKLLAYIVDAHCSFTCQHSIRVSAVSRRIAEAAGLDKQTCLMLETAGYLHDIGKLSVSPDVLSKPGRLNEEEILLVRRHSYMTGIILADIDGLGKIVEWAADHHERENGSGYPWGLNEHELSSEGKIIAIADVYVALTEDRPYRKGLSGAEAMKIVNAQFRQDRYLEVLQRIYPTL